MTQCPHREEESSMSRSIAEVRELIVARIEMEDGVIPDGHVLPISPIDADDQPRVLICQSEAGILIFCREDVPQSVRERITALRERAFIDENSVRSILSEISLRGEVRRIRWYTMESVADIIAYPDVQSTSDGFVITVDTSVVSRAWTTQESERAIEVEVEANPQYRGRGFAKQVVAAWADWARGSGKTAFYSHLLTNDASAGIAKSLGLHHLSDETEFL